PRDFGDQPRSPLDSVDTLRRKRGMAGLATHGDAHAALALVPDDATHQRRLADQAGRRLYLGLLEHLDDAAGADAAHLFVIRECEMDGTRELVLLDCLTRREADRNETLHVAGAARIGAAVVDAQLEGVAAPGLAIDRHHVGMAGEDDTRHVRRADAGPKIGLAAGRVRDAFAAEAMAGKMLLGPVDQRQVGIA